MPIGLYRKQIEINVKILRKFCLLKKYYTNPCLYKEGEIYFKVVAGFPPPKVVLAISFVFQTDASQWSPYHTQRALTDLCRVIKTPGSYDWQNSISKFILKPRKFTLSELKEFVAAVSKTITPVSVIPSEHSCNTFRETN